MEKKLLTLGLLLLLSFMSYGQTDGITYQAVIIGPDKLELPGVDSEGNYLPSTNVAIRFTIFDSGNLVEFQEIQTTTTDEFGRINLIIGAVEHDNFEKISWDGTPKDLKVEIDFEGGNSFVDMSRETLTFVPYAYHRNITATGTLDVDDDTFLNRELTVNGPTNLNSTLSVNGGNATSLTGDLTVDGNTNLNGTLDVNNKSTTNLSGALNVGVATGLEDVDAPTILNGTLNVVGKTTVADFEATGQSTFNDLVANTLQVNTSSILDGISTIGNSNDDVINITGGLSITSNQQVNISSSVSANGDGQTIGNHPVLIQGSNNGLAIRVSGSRNNSTNFITFFDTTRNAPWGRIEGEIPSEYGNNADYLFDQSSLDYDIYDAELDYGFALANEIIAGAQLIKASSDFRGCVGLGGCLASPGPADIAFAGVELISAAAQAIFQAFAIDRANDNKTTYDNNKNLYQGVTYASGAGDYAEYLLRSDVNESMKFGDIVAVNGGKVSKNTAKAERMMVVSLKPIVLGNMPQEHRKNEYEKVAFMGQVPVRIFGKVEIGDYIIPSGKNDGVGLAISPTDLGSNNVENIVGVAWSANNGGFGMVTVAVGLNRNDNNTIVKALEEKVETQGAEIEYLKDQLAEIKDLLYNLENGNITSKQARVKHEEDDNHEVTVYDDRKYEIVDTDKGEIVYWEVTQKDFEKGLQVAEVQMRAEGIDVDNHFIWKKIKEDPTFKNKVFNKIKEQLDRQVHYHKEFNKKDH